MATELVLDQSSVAAVLAVVFALVGLAQGGARSVLSVAASLAIIVGLGEPAVATRILDLGGKLAGVLSRALGRAEPITLGSPGPYFFLVYVGVVVAVMLLSRALLAEPIVSRSSRLFGGLLGALNGLLFALMLREYLLPSLGGALSQAVIMRLRLGPEISAQALPAGGLSVGTVAYVFGLLLAGAALLRKARRLRRTRP